MEKQVDLLKQIKKQSWSLKEEWSAKNVGMKMKSPHKILSTITEPIDWDKVSESVSQNPNHELFGKDPEEIRAIWKSNGSKGADRGIKLDDYITAKLIDAYFNLDAIEDDKLKAKCGHFDELYESHLSKLDGYVGSEIWLNSAKLGVICRLDSLFTFGNGLLVAEWKNTEKLTTRNTFRNLLGPAGLLQETDLNKFTLQTHFYRYILEELGYSNVKTRVFQFTEEKYEIHQEPFKYDPKFIEEIVKYSKDKI